MWVRWSLGFVLALALAACGGGGVPERVSGPAPARHPPPRGSLPRAAAPEAPPISITVGPGDTVASLADRHRVSIRDLIEANRLEPPYRLAPGQALLIPRSRTHRVMRGETLYGISRFYHTDLRTLARLNGLGPPYNIYAGQSLRVPLALPAPLPVTTAVVEPQPQLAPAAARTDIEVSPVPAPTPAAAPSPQVSPTADPPPPIVAKPDPAPQVAALPPARAGSLLFSWPVKGRVVSGFGPKPGGQHNDGINIEVARGTPVHAAEAGTVVYAGNELKGYGNLVLIRHAGGWVTAYAHNDEILVRRGAQIGKGHLIAKSGSSGGIGAPQVHFEIRRGRDPVDPMRYLGAPETVSGAAGRAGPPGPG